MRILILTYPLAAVTDEACGGAEQTALVLLRGLAQEPEIEITWIGAEGSAAVPGVDFLSWPKVLARYGWLRPLPPALSPEALADLERRCNQAVLAWIAEHPTALVHNQGGFFRCAAPCPVLFTLHLARRLYPSDLLEAPICFQCVSRTQQREYGAGFPVVPNGIDLTRFHARSEQPQADAPLLYLGRICPEKAPHLAIAAARLARRRLIIAGSVAPFPFHQDYFRRYIVPELDTQIRWLAPPSFRGKLALLAAAAAVIVPSQIDETSSLAAMEAAASGVPAITTRRGALPEIVAHGETGWLADSAEELAAAAANLAAIAPGACRARAEREFDSRRMVAAYTALYRELAAGRARAA